MSGDLPAENRLGLEQHLEACTDCRKYRDDVGSMTALLAARRELFLDVEPRESAQRRWTRDFEAAVEPAHSVAIFRGFLDWSRDMVWPSRRIWVGMAAIWVVILSLNASSRPKQETRTAHRPSPEIMRALLVREGFLAAGRTASGRESEPPRPLAPQPRSERHRGSDPA